MRPERLPSLFPCASSFRVQFQSLRLQRRCNSPAIRQLPDLERHSSVAFLNMFGLEFEF